MIVSKTQRKIRASRVKVRVDEERKRNFHDEKSLIEKVGWKRERERERER